MALYFDVKLNKHRPPRISVIRKTRHASGLSQQKHLGVLPDNREEAAAFFADRLDLAERCQLENYLANIAFNQQYFKTGPEMVERDLLYFSPVCEGAILELWTLAMQQGLAFNPHEIMLNALLDKAKSIERALNKKLGKVDILESIGIDIGTEEGD